MEVQKLVDGARRASVESVHLATSRRGAETGRCSSGVLASSTQGLGAVTGRGPELARAIMVAVEASTRPGRTDSGETGDRLLADGLAETTLARLGSQATLCLDFMEVDGRDWVQAGPYDVLAYVGALFNKGSIAGRSIAGYVSAVTSFYTKIGMTAPRLVAPRVTHPVVKQGMEVFRGNKAKQETLVPPPGATECDFIVSSVQRVLAALTRGDFGIVRAWMMQVWQLYTFDRPTSCVMTIRVNVRITNGVLSLTRPSLALGRKDK